MRPNFIAPALPPLPLNEAKALLRKQLEALARQPDCYALFEGKPLSFALAEATLPMQGMVTIPQTGDVPARTLVVMGQAFDRRPDVLAFLVWLFPDQTIKRLEAELALAAPSDGAVLPSKDRAAKMADLQAKILNTERDEEASESLARTRVHPRAGGEAVTGIVVAPLVRGLIRPL